MKNTIIFDIFNGDSLYIKKKLKKYQKFVQNRMVESILIMEVL